MKRKLLRTNQASDGNFMAELDCGHLMKMAATASPELTIHCQHCDRLALQLVPLIITECRKILETAYEDAGLSGLCDEGRWEAAVGSLSSIDEEKLLASISGLKD
jgi:hypothetical protein